LLDKKFKNNTEKYQTLYEFSKIFDTDNFAKFTHDLEDQYVFDILSDKENLNECFRNDKQ